MTRKTDLANDSDVMYSFKKDFKMRTDNKMK